MTRTDRTAIAQRHAMVLGCELYRVNGLRAIRAKILARDARYLDGCEIGSGYHAAGLRAIARLDAKRRALRGLLADALEGTVQ